MMWAGQGGLAGETSTRSVVHYFDGDCGMRAHDFVVAVGEEVTDGGARYRVVRVEQPPHERAFGQPGWS
jgi:hypothetical protein